MSKNELERIVLDTLEQFQTEILETQINQTQRIELLERLSNAYEKELTDLSDLYKRLIPLTKDLETLLKNHHK